MNYILFCGQEGNFQTRSMLISYDLLIETIRGKKYLDILNKYSVYDEKVNGYVLLFNDEIEYEENLFSVISDLIYYAEGMFDELDFELNKICQVLDKEDFHWVNSILCHPVSKGFNHIENFKKGMKMKKYRNHDINIIKGYLCLRRY